MRRKIIRQGHNTLTITLPINWARKWGLGSGQDVELIEKENGLFISAEKKNSYSHTSFEITPDMEIPTIWKYFMSAYRQGYDELVVRFQPGLTFDNPYKFFSTFSPDYNLPRSRMKKTSYEAIQDIVNRFIGWEIIEHSIERCIIKDLGDVSTKEFDNSLRRVFLLLLQMVEEVDNAVKTNQPKSLRHMHEIDVNTDKFVDYCLRVLNKTGLKDQKNTDLLYSTLYLLEMIGDEFKMISNHLMGDFDKSSMKNLQRACELIFKQINLFYEVFYKFSLEKINEICKCDKETYEIVTIPHYNKVYRGEEIEVLSHMRRISRHISSLTELRISLEFG